MKKLKIGDSAYIITKDKLGFTSDSLNSYTCESRKFVVKNNYFVYAYILYMQCKICYNIRTGK